MTKEVANRVISLINKGIKDLGDVGPEFFDELNLLCSRVRDFFPAEFNSLQLDSSYSGIKHNNLATFRRLKKILEVYDSLPDELRTKGANEDNQPTALIPLFDLKKSDKDRIFELCSDMRKIVFSTTIFDEPHRLRLLNRIAAMEAETHKPKGMFDVMRGGMDDLGETLHKFGTNLEPLVKRMQEVVGLARKGTKEYDQLPAPEEVKKLPPPTDDDTV